MSFVVCPRLLRLTAQSLHNTVIINFRDFPSPLPYAILSNIHIAKQTPTMQTWLFIVSMHGCVVGI